MPKSKQQKEKDLAELTEKLKSAKAAVFADYRGTSVKDITRMRSDLRKAKVFSKVYKLTLIKRALKGAGIEGEIADYKAPVILSLSAEDETAPAREIKNLSKEIKAISILEGITGGKMIAKDMVLALANLPGKDQLRARLVGTINAPITGFVNVLARNLKGLMNVFNAMASK